MREIGDDVILSAAQGDLRSFEEIYKAASGFVYNVSLKVTGNNEDACEITQDVFMKVHKNLKSFERRSSLKTWLYRITVNTALNYKRRTSQELQKRVEPDDKIQYADKKNATKEMIDQQDNDARVNALLDQLDVDHRTCIVLREIQGLNYKEIAEALNINLNTVRTRLKRARQKLLELAGKGVS